MAKFPNLSLVLGGVSSGKSAWAETLVRSAALPKTYMATARDEDGEMKAKISRHQEMRGSDWQTVEEPLNLVGALEVAPRGQIILIDCLTLWLSNHMMEKNDLDQTFNHLVAALTDSAKPVVIVSNEVGLGGIAENALARQFQRHQGRLNQRIAAISDLVVMVTAGLPLTLKGQSPKDLL